MSTGGRAITLPTDFFFSLEQSTLNQLASFNKLKDGTSRSLCVGLNSILILPGNKMAKHVTREFQCFLLATQSDLAPVSGLMETYFRRAAQAKTNA